MVAEVLVVVASQGKLREVMAVVLVHSTWLKSALSLSFLEVRVQ